MNQINENRFFFENDYQELEINIVKFSVQIQVFHPQVNADFQHRLPLIGCIYQDLQVLVFDYRQCIIFVISDNHQDFLTFVYDYFVNKDVLNFQQNLNFQF